ncbi:hypothetical protein [Wolbachia pipientis]|uniref:hypothetical protein n=1 Tax=Wolbachia pipientis TaxID=955 RepID=UPI0011D076FE|nr:hypothetical protein [Wolbachia pipientis]
MALIFLSYGFQYTMETISPLRAFSELYTYIKMCYNHRSNLGYGILIRTLLALLIPNLCYRTLLNIQWKLLIRKVMVKCIRTVRKENKTLYSKENYVEYEHDMKLVNMIKHLLMRDIEQTIEKRLHDIFLSKKHNKD